MKCRIQETLRSAQAGHFRIDLRFQEFSPLEGEQRLRRLFEQQRCLHVVDELRALTVPGCAIENVQRELIERS